MPNSFFNKLTSSLNIQKEEDDATDFYQALDNAQAQESAPQGVGDDEGGEEYADKNETEPFAATPGEEGGEEEDSEGEATDETEEEEMGSDVEPTIAHLAMAKSNRGSVRERARRVFSPTATMGDDEADGQLAIDVYQTDSEIVIKSVIAGVRPEDLDITIGDDTVTVRGSRTKDEQVSNENYYYQECYWGSFSRSVILPVEIDRERAEASFKNGILTIRLPKLEKNRTKKIRIAME